MFLDTAYCFNISIIGTPFDFNQNVEIGKQPQLCGCKIMIIIKTYTVKLHWIIEIQRKVTSSQFPL